MLFVAKRCGTGGSCDFLGSPLEQDGDVRDSSHRAHNGTGWAALQLAGQARYPYAIV
jgi:hypothetical protein